MLRVATTGQVSSQAGLRALDGSDGTELLGGKAERRDERARSLYGLGCVGKVSLAVPMRLSRVSRKFRDGDFVW
jgi:hypothetical protein